MVISKGIVKISIIVPCFNQSDYLEDCLSSIINQTYENWECMIVNDGSTDNTYNIINKWTKKDNRFIGLNQDNGGLSSARNSGLLKATGEWIQFLDSDDILPKDRFSYLIDKLNLKNTDVVISNFNHLNEGILQEPYCILDPLKFNLKDIVMKWDEDFTIPIHSGLFKRNLFDFFAFNTNLRAKEDWLMWTQIFLKNPVIVYESRMLATYRIHKDSMTRNNDINIFENNLRVTFYLRELLKDHKDLADDFLEQRIKKFSNQIIKLKEHHEKTLNSNSYRLAKFLLRPLGWIKNFNIK